MSCQKIQKIFLISINLYVNLVLLAIVVLVDTPLHHLCTQVNNKNKNKKKISKYIN